MTLRKKKLQTYWKVLAKTAQDETALGQMRGGRFLRVIYIRDPQPDSIFVITAYELRGKPLLA